MNRQLLAVTAFTFVFGAVSPAQMRLIDRVTKKPSPPVPLNQRGLLGNNFSSGKHVPRKIGPFLPGQGLQIPHWTSSFNYQGTVYATTVAGTDPALGQTTVIPAVIVPYRLVFADGYALDATTDLIDGVTPVNGIVNSPIFQNIAWNSGPTQLGMTQWSDAVMRANYWGTHSDQGQGYHVRLSTPTVLPAVVIHVPADKGFTGVDQFGHRFGIVDFEWMDIVLENETVALGITPDTLPIHLFSYVLTEFLNGGEALGYHFAFNVSSDPSTPVLQTMIQTGYFSVNSRVRPAAANTAVLGHELAEWLNDPSGDNFVPAWQDPAFPHICDNPLKEVGDPLELTSPGFQMMSGGTSYTFPDVAFAPWFSRTEHSLSANGWFSFLNNFSSFSEACPVFTNFGYVQFDFIGADTTILNSLNNNKQAVGVTIFGGNGFSFLLGNVDPIHPGNLTVSLIHVPGSLAEGPGSINDAGDVVGAYLDASGVVHGYLFSIGVYSTIDFPGATSTEAQGINNKMEIVGDYADAQGVLHGFILRGNNFSTIDVPSAVNTVVTSINDHEKIAGSYDTDGAVISGFVGTLGALAPLNLPNETLEHLETTATQAISINDLEQIAGISTQVDARNGFTQNEGFLEGGGNFQQIDLGFDGSFFTQTLGINNSGEVVGTFQDLTGGHAFIGVPTQLFSNIPNSMKLTLP